MLCCLTTRFNRAKTSWKLNQRPSIQLTTCWTWRTISIGHGIGTDGVGGGVGAGGAVGVGGGAGGAERGFEV